MSTDKTNSVGESSSANLTASMDITETNKEVRLQPEPKTSKPKKKDKKLEAQKDYQAYLRAKSRQDDRFEIVERPAAGQTSHNGGKDENLDEGWVDGETYPEDSGDDDEEEEEPLHLEWEKFKMKMNIGNGPSQSETTNAKEAAKHKRNQRSS